MKNFIDAFMIFRKYISEDDFNNHKLLSVSHADFIVNIDPAIISKNDNEHLQKLGFNKLGNKYINYFLFADLTVSYKKAIFELLWAVYEYDDKPHRFFVKLEALVSLFNDSGNFDKHEIKIIKDNINKMSKK